MLVACVSVWWGKEEYVVYTALEGYLFCFDDFFSSSNYENVSVSLIKRRTAVPIDGLVGIEVAWEILNK